MKPLRIATLSLAVFAFAMLAGCSAEHYYDKGQDYLAEREYDKAIENFQKAADKEPEEPMYAQAVVDARRQASVYYASEAQAKLNARDLAGADTLARRAQNYQSDNPQAAAVLAQSAQLASSAEAKRTQAMQLAGQGQFDAALARMRDALADNRTLPGGQADMQRIQADAAAYHVNLAQQHLAANRLAEAEAEARRAQSYDPNNQAAANLIQQVTNYREADRLVNQARTALAQGRHEDALPDLERAAQLAPQRSDIPGLLLSTKQVVADKHIARGRQFEQLGQFDQALNEYNQARALLPNYGNVDALIAGVSRRVAESFRAKADAAFAAQRWGAAYVYGQIANLHSTGTVAAWALNDRANRLRQRAGRSLGIATGTRNNAGIYRIVADRIGSVTISHMQQWRTDWLDTLSENTLSQRLSARGLLPANLIGPTFDAAARQVTDVDFIASVEVSLLQVTNTQTQTNGTSEWQDGFIQQANPDYATAKSQRDAAAAEVATLQAQLANLTAQRTAILAQPPSPARDSALANINAQISAKNAALNAAQNTLQQRQNTLSQTPQFIQQPRMRQHTYPIYTHTRTGQLTAIVRFHSAAPGNLGNVRTVTVEQTWTDTRVVANPARNVPGDPLELPSEDASRAALADVAALHVNTLIESVVAEASGVPLVLARDAEQRGQVDEAVERYADFLATFLLNNDSSQQAWQSLRRLCSADNLSEAQTTQLAAQVSDTFRSLTAVAGRLDMTVEQREDGLWATGISGLNPGGLQLPAHITTINGTRCQTIYGLKFATAAVPVGQSVPVIFEQNGNTYTGNIRKVAE